MSTLPQRPSSQPGDGLGYRVLGFDKKTGDRLEMLRVRPQFSGQAAFETALRDRLRRLAEFRSPTFARVRQIDRLTGQAAGIAIVSNHLDGVRLGDLLNVAESYQVRVDVDTTLCLVRQLVSAVASLHTCGPEIGHGCLGPERLLITPDARLVVTEYVLGGALEAMQWTRERFWQEFRIALPPGPDPATFDQQTDIMQVGLLTLALLEGRGIYAERQYPLPLAERVKQAKEIPVNGAVQPLKPAFATWLARALQLDAAHAFRSMDEALVALDLVIGEGHAAAPSAVTTFVDRCRQASPDLRPRDTDAASSDPATKSTGDRPSAAPAADAKRSTSGTTSSTSPASPAAPLTAGSPSAGAMPPASAKPGVPAAPAASATPSSSAPSKTAPPAGSPASTTTRSGGLPISASTTSVAAGSVDAAQKTKAASDAKSESSRTSASVGASATGASIGSDKPSSPTASFLGGETMVDDTTGTVPADLVAAPRSGGRKVLVAVLGLLVIVAAGVPLVLKYANPFGGGNAAQASATPAMPSSMGVLAIDASPRAATVFIDDVARGSTPLRVDLAPGTHTVRLDGGENITRTFPVTVTAGKEISHLVELSRNLETGALDVRSDPAGARVSLDGKAIGQSPVSIADIPPGDHVIVVDGPQNSVRQTVKVIAGTRASIVVPLSVTPASPAAGWLTVVADHELQVMQDGQLVGTSRAEKLMMAAGTYQLDLTNDDLGFSVSRSVQVQPGKVTRVSVQVPDGTLSVNAAPWAEIWVDGNRIGETPVGNLPMRAGSHEVVFRNPKFADKKQTVTVRPGQPARVTVDMTK